ncbi:hypothetical protein [Variovorax sp. RCC_210]|uniref:hypothetical protein n=1 Tax=Variovorax sp. RCC_210 TaxID=3239217 RepID=UPI003526967B
MADNFSLKAILSAVDRLSPVLKGVQGVAKTTRKYLGDVGTSINGLTSKFGVPLGILSTIAAGFGVAAIKKAVVGYAELGEEVTKGALKAGTSAEQYQRMKYVAEQSDTSIEALSLSMGKLNKNLGAAVSGKNADLVDLFKTLHIPMRDVNGQIRNGVDMLPELAEAFKKNQNPVVQATMGTAAFGKSYQDLLPLLNEGAEGIKKNLDRFKTLKGVISADDLAGAKEFGDKLKDVDIVTKGFQMTIAKELVPVLSPLIEKFIQWAAVNKKLVAGEVKKVFQELVTSLKQIDWAALFNGIRETASSIAGAVSAVGGLKNALIILAVVMNLQTILAVFGVIGAFGRMALALGGLALRIPLVASLVGLIGTSLLAAGRAVLIFSRALLLSPIGVILGIAAAAWAIYENWDTLKGWFSSFMGWLSSQWSSVTDSALSFGSSLTGQIVSAWESVRTWFTGLFEGMDEGWKNVVLWCFPFIAIGKTIIDNWEPLKAWFTSLFDWLGQKFAWAISVAQRIGGAVGSVFAADGPQASAATSAAALGASGAPAAPGSLGSGSFNLNTPTQATLNGRLDVSFKDAPPGMRVEQAKTDGGRVAMNTDVGYRYTGALGY